MALSNCTYRLFCSKCSSKNGTYSIPISTSRQTSFKDRLFLLPAATLVPKLGVGTSKDLSLGNPKLTLHLRKRLVHNRQHTVKLGVGHHQRRRQVQNIPDARQQAPFGDQMI